MDEHLAAADAALKAGDKTTATNKLIAALEADPNRNVGVYRALCVNLFQLNRNAEGAEWVARAVERFPKDVELWNMRAVFLRRLHRQPEALVAADEAVRLGGKDISPLINRANILNDMGDPRAEAEWTKLVRRDPKNGEFHRLLARALRKQGKDDAALARLRQAVMFSRNNSNSWVDLVGFYNDFGRVDEALSTLDKALEIFPDLHDLLAGKAVILRGHGRKQEAEEYLESLLPRFGDKAWLHFTLGQTIADGDRDRATAHYRRAVELAPTLEHLVALVESLNRLRSGNEGENIEESYQIAKRALAIGGKLASSDTKILGEVFWRVGDYERVAQVGDFASMGREWAKTGRHTALMAQLGRIKGPDDVRELMEQHRTWGRDIQRRADAGPIHPPGPRPSGGKLRLGLMSSDLRLHPVGYFTMPLIEHIDHDRFELYCYSYYHGGEADGAQKKIAAAVDGFRWWRDISPRDAAQEIAKDQLDMLIELGGSTHMNKLEVMAYRPAGLQASWLGYPHSAGLDTIDYLVVDPYILPKDPSLLIEKPMVLPNCWYSTSPMAFRAEPKEAETPPLQRNGFVTFGTANNPNKYSAEVLASWARIVRRTPGSRFLFIRPEGNSASFRAHMIAAFTREGVEAGRIQFAPVRGKHLPFYNAIDMSLDTFPQTGGTTTCESLWMGAPVVSLVGEALFQRLSYSVLTNLGLGDLCATTVQGFEDTAVALANDPARIAELRATMRQRIGDSPLGRVEQWARDFYDTVARTVAA